MVHEAGLVQKLAKLLLCCAALVDIVFEGQLVLAFVKVLVILLKIDLFISQLDCTVPKQAVPVRIVHVSKNLGHFCLIVEPCLIQLLLGVWQVSVSLVHIFARLVDHTINFKTAPVTHAARLREARRAPARIRKVFIVDHERVVVGDETVKVLLALFDLCAGFATPRIRLLLLLLRVVLAKAAIVPIVLRQELVGR